VIFLWRTPTLHDYDRHDIAAQRRLIGNLYGDMGWEVPRLLAELENADDLYLDQHDRDGYLDSRPSKPRGGCRLLPRPGRRRRN
jgi:hypothetical protein